MSIKRYNGQIDYFGIGGAAFSVTGSQANIATSDIVPIKADGTASGFKADVTGATLQSDYSVLCGANAEGGVALPAPLALLTVAAADLPEAISAWKFATSGWTLNTAAGTLPTFSVTATGAIAECFAQEYDLGDNVVISPFACSQLLFGIGSASGGEVASANYTCSGSVQTKPNGDNAPAVADLAQCIITAAISIQQSADSTKPTFTLGNGWTLQQPLAVSSTVGGVTTWTLTAIKTLDRLVGT